MVLLSETKNELLHPCREVWPVVGKKRGAGGEHKIKPL